MRVAIFGFALAAVDAVSAGEGVVEINQAVVEASGGFPYTISSPGSYRLTGNLTVPDANTTAIEITADDVTLDLGGFAIQGVTTCTETPTTCSNTGSGHGIFSIQSGLAIRNGQVRGMGSLGIRVGDGARISAITVVENGNSGITASGRLVVTDCVVRTNGFHGIEAGSRSIVRNCVAANNFADGIVANQSTVIEGNAAAGNAGGIRAEGSSVVRGNTVRGNGGDGIQTGAGSTVNGNTAYSNGGFGLDLSANVGYSQNSVNGNTGGTVDDGIDAGGNVCDGSLGCP